MKRNKKKKRIHRSSMISLLETIDFSFTNTGMKYLMYKFYMTLIIYKFLLLNKYMFGLRLNVSIKDLKKVHKKMS